MGPFRILWENGTFDAFQRGYPLLKLRILAIRAVFRGRNTQKTLGRAIA
jgi:hypothetical protein